MSIQLTLFSLQLIGAAILTALSYFYYVVWRKRQTLPPGPWPLPLVGNLLDLRGPDLIHDKFARLGEQYGDPFTLWLGMQPSIVCNKKEAIDEVLFKQSSIFCDRNDSRIFQLLGKNSNDILLGRYGPTWKIQRKLATQSLRRIIDRSLLEEIAHRSVDSVVDSLLEKVKPNKPFDDLRDYCSNMIFNVITSFCYGKWYEVDDADFKRIIFQNKHMNELFVQCSLIDWLPMAEYIPWRKVWSVAQELDTMLIEYTDFISERIEEQRRTYEKGNIRHFVDAMIAEQEELRKDKDNVDLLSDSHLMWAVYDFFSAGVDTTNATLEWFFELMIKYPDIQERCYQEITMVCGDRPPMLEDKPEMPFMVATINETLRAHAPASLVIPHAAIKDTKLGRYEIPKGMAAIINIYPMHQDEEGDFGPNASAFDPERHWLERDGSGKMVVRQRMVGTFGGGRRACMGEHHARNNLFLLTSGLLQKLKFLPVAGERYDLKIDPNMELVLSPIPYKAMIERR